MDHQVERNLRAITKGRVAWSLIQRADDVRRAHPVWRDTQIDLLEVTAAGESPTASSLGEVEEWLARRPGTGLTSAFVRWTPGGQAAAPGVPNRIAIRLLPRYSMLWVGHNDDIGANEMANRLAAALAEEAERLSPRGVSTFSGPLLDLPGPAPLAHHPKEHRMDTRSIGDAVARTSPASVGEATAPPSAMITWSHSDPEGAAGLPGRKAEVLGLAGLLRANGIDADLDLYHLSEAVS